MPKVNYWHLFLYCLAMPSITMASPYFRPLDIAHPAPVVGALIAPEELGASEAVSLLPLITHSTRDGCWIPSVVCSDWTPLAVGASINAGKVTLNIAPLVNVLPWMQGMARAVVPDSMPSIRRVLASNPDQAVTFSAGPVWQYRQRENRGYFRLFSGVALHF
jgi:hypothetical protein